MADDATWRVAGDCALLRAFPEGDLAEANRAARALYRRLAERRFPEVEDLIPAARSVLVLLRPGLEPGRELLAAMHAEPGPGDAADEAGSRLHEIPVAYGGEAGPDLAEVAALRGLSEGEVVRLHAEPAYTVGFLGFAPGFPYLIGLPERLATPRLATPRTKVPAGSVGIGGGFTGIYPRATPGGWRLIGRTGVELFDPGRDPPAFLLPGDRVRFVAT